ncbi:AVB_G0043260.mRNA.1.CDS.1 [Saccharomyces cerevisiae]|nr:AVB_G0043260.mRNA.1.CDS.1 [Saccharomyces cerevisiae]CAI7253688.1 AVB_G0043260.mRNA.1.CDS.1 [Saccharomyces cerevisiae]
MLSNVINEKLNLTDDGENERMAERLHAARICKWGKPSFGLDGIMRVEVGLEVKWSSLTSTRLYQHLPLSKRGRLASGLQMGNLVEDQLTDDQKAILEREDGWEKTFLISTQLRVLIG